MDYLDLFRRGTEWTATKVSAAEDDLSAPTPCDEWDVRTLINHMLDTQRYFTEATRNKEAVLPRPTPPEIVGDEPMQQYAQSCQATLEAFQEPGVRERSGSLLGIAFADQLLHGWDLAVATHQDTAMPEDLAQAAFDTINGRMPNDKRGPAFKPAIPVSVAASPQEKLLAYSGRKP